MQARILKRKFNHDDTAVDPLWRRWSRWRRDGSTIASGQQKAQRFCLHQDHLVTLVVRWRGPAQKKGDPYLPAGVWKSTFPSPAVTMMSRLSPGGRCHRGSSSSSSSKLPGVGCGHRVAGHCPSTPASTPTTPPGASRDAVRRRSCQQELAALQGGQWWHWRHCWRNWWAAAWEEARLGTSRVGGTRRGTTSPSTCSSGEVRELPIAASASCCCQWSSAKSTTPPRAPLLELSPQKPLLHPPPLFHFALFNLISTSAEPEPKKKKHCKYRNHGLRRD